MAKPRDEFLVYLQSHPYFPIFLKDLQNHRPLIPAYDMDSDNTNKWKFLTAQQKGFDLCLSIFNIKLE